MNQPEFSIIIPTFNRSGHLVEAVESVLRQTHPAFEVVVVDDGSTDDTRDVMGRLCAADERVRYVHQENGGRSSARNKGIENSRADWLIFLDSDDLLEATALQTFATLRSEHPKADIIAGAKSFMDESGNPIREPWKELDPDRSFGLIDDPYVRLIRQFFFTPGTYCMRREKCPRFKKELEPCEDYDFLLSAAVEASVVRSPEKVHRYRWHSGNTSQGLFAAARLKVSLENEKVLKSFEPARCKVAGAEWANRRADDYYEQGRSLKAAAEYFKALLLNPSKVGEGQIPRQLAACLVPAHLRLVVRERVHGVRSGKGVQD